MYIYHLDVWNCEAPDRYLFVHTSYAKLPRGGLELQRAKSISIIYAFVCLIVAWML